MASLLGAALRPRNNAPIPYTGRRASSMFAAAGPSSSNQLARMGQVGTLFAIVNRTSTATAAPDWQLYRKPADGKPAPDADRQVVARHAAVDLWNSPNPFYTQSQLVEAVQQHIDLAGEGFLVVVKAGKIPIELWPVRPDRMTPRTDPTKYLLGWTYRTPDGDKIDLDHDEVIQLKMPNPEDPFRGLSPVTPMIAELDSAQAATQWSSNFFRNSAQPGGIIEVPEGLSDEEFDQMREHWAEQHQGVSNAHRVAIIEHGTWKTTTFSPRDLDFSALRNLGRDAIMEAYGISRATLGITDGVNYAAAKAAAAQFASLVAVPRLERWKQALNARLLPMFGPTSKGVEFDYDSPAESDPDEENAERTSRVNAAVALLNVTSVRFDPKATLEAFGLPDIPFEDAPEPPAPVIAPPTPPGQDPSQPDPGQDPAKQDPKQDPAQDPAATGSQPEARVQANATCTHGHPLRNADGPDQPDLSALQAAWEKAVDKVLAQWADVTAAQRAELRAQIVSAVDDGDLARLATLTANSDNSAQFLAEAMDAMARTAAQHVADEAQAQGVTIPQATPPADDLLATATAVAALLAAGLAIEAGREAIRVHRPGMTGAQVAAAVDEHLRSLSDRAQRDAAGGALTGAQNGGMRATYQAAQAQHTEQGNTGPVGSLYASEVLDTNTCLPCREIDGRFICTTDDLSAHDKLYTALGGYVGCLGGVRCRGTTTGVWRPQTVDNA